MVALLHAFFATAPLAATARALARGYPLGQVRVLCGSLCGRQASTLAINAVSLAGPVIVLIV